MIEHWNLYLNLDYQAASWPWPGKGLADLTAADVASLPGTVDDFLRYSPTDGTTDRVHVPPSLPREVPAVRTELAVYHDARHLYVFIVACQPAAPIPELADCPNEDFMVVLPTGCPGRGVYFGMNQKGEHIGCIQVWDRDFPCKEGDLPATGEPDAAGPSGWQSTRLDGRYAARVIATATGMVGCFQIDRTLALCGHTPHLNPLPQGERTTSATDILLPSGDPTSLSGVLPLPSGERVGVRVPSSFRLSAGRTCYAAGEWVSWGSPLVWSAREDQHGAVRLVDVPCPPRHPTLTRIDLEYSPDAGFCPQPKQVGRAVPCAPSCVSGRQGTAGPTKTCEADASQPPTEQSESASVKACWHGITPESIRPFVGGSYAGYADKVTLALIGREVTVPLAASTHASFPIPDGWNRLEVLSAPNPVKEISFQKVSGHTLQPVPDVAGCTMPALPELREAFARWHTAHDQTCLENGIWGDKVGHAAAKRRYCLCHSGIFHIEPYLIASRYLARQPDYDRRIRETCERMLAEQKPAGWYPCYCSANRREPELGDGGAFTNGSVGEGMVLAADLLSEPAWLASAERAADYAWYRWENNQNYAAFALWHLAALYARDRQSRWLDQALYLARNFVIRDIGLSGAQGGHNFFTAYGNITLKGMSRLLAVLPRNHEFRPVLRDKVMRFANQILSRQQPSGLCAGRNRKYLGYHHPVPGLFFVAEAIPEQASRLEPALAAMTRAILRGGEEDLKRKVDSDSGLVLALATRFVMQKDGGQGTGHPTPNAATR